MNNLINIFNDIKSFLMSIFAIFGGITAILQWNNSIKIKRAEYLSNLYDKLNNETIKSIIYMFDYNKTKWYDENFHKGGSQLEIDVDETLNLFSFICYIYERKLISQKEFNFFKYQLDRSLSSPQVEEYLYNVYHHCIHNKTDLCFNSLYNYIKKNKIYNDEFFNNSNCTAYNVYLDWGKSK